MASMWSEQLRRNERDIEEGRPPIKYPLGKYGLAKVLISAFLVTITLQGIFQYYEVRNEAIEHGQTFAWGQFWIIFWRAVMENWQSEFLQVIAYAALTVWFIYESSAQSRDEQDKIRAQLNRMEATIDDTAATVLVLASATDRKFAAGPNLVEAANRAYARAAKGYNPPL